MTSRITRSIVYLSLKTGITMLRFSFGPDYGGGIRWAVKGDRDQRARLSPAATRTLVKRH